jgi:uncharacterized protein
MRSTFLVAAILIVLGWTSASFAADQSLDSQLVAALRQGDASEMQRLINQGADATRPWLLTTAVEAGRLDALKVLLAHGANPNAWVTAKYQTDAGPAHSPVYLSAQRGDRKMLQYLKNHGADFNAESPSGSVRTSTLLMNAASDGETETARFLIEYGAKVDQVSRQRTTALYQAVAERRSACVELLLQHRANPDVEDDDGITARGLAYRSGSNELVAMIEKAKPATTAQRISSTVSEQEREGLKFLLAIKAACDAKLPNFPQESAVVYARWRSSRAPILDSIERSQRWQRGLEAISADQDHSSVSSAELTQLDGACRKELTAEFAKPYMADPGSPRP